MGFSEYVDDLILEGYTYKLCRVSYATRIVFTISSLHLNTIVIAIGSCLTVSAGNCRIKGYGHRVGCMKENAKGVILPLINVSMCVSITDAYKSSFTFVLRSPHFLFFLSFFFLLLNL